MRLLCCAIGLLLLLPAFGLQAIFDNFPHTDSPTLEQAGLRGPVKTMRSYLQKDGRLVEELTFDPGGRLIQEMRYHTNDGKLQWKHYYRYDDAGRLIKATSVGAFVKETGATYTFGYDVQGWKTEETFISYDMRAPTQTLGSTTHRWTYDAYGNAIDNPRPYAWMGIWYGYREFTYYE